MNWSNAWKSLDYLHLKQTNSPFFSTIIFVAMILVIVAGTLFSNISLESSIFSLGPNVPMNAEPSPLAPPKNTTSKDRIAWLRTNLPQFEVFRATNVSEQFHGRVVKFFKESCEVRFFMTWMGPAEGFGTREFWAVESVFKAHPHGCLMIVSASMDSPRGHNILKPLLKRRFKVTAVTPDFPWLVHGTPAKAWFDEMKSCKRDPGRIPLNQNVSNLLRLAIIYKYGGVYVDTDYIVMRSFKGLKNSIGAQTEDAQSRNWTRLNNAVLIFDKNHPLLFHFIEEFASTFDGNKWGHNGPYLVTRVAKRAVKGEIGKRFTVLPPTALYPLNWMEIQSLFRMPLSTNESRRCKAQLFKLNRESYGLHLWNKITRKLQIQKGSLIDRVISDHCVICPEMKT